MRKLHKIISLTVIFISVWVLYSFEFPSQEKWIAPPSADKISNPLINDLSATKSGKSLFNTYCIVCHGPKGKGDGMAAVGLTPKPSNLTSQEVQNQTDGAIYWKITTGRPPMAAYKDLIPDNDIWALVNYIKTLKK